jgi:hypothetical protein
MKKKITLSAIVLLLALGAFVFANLGGTVKRVIERAGTQALGTEVSVGAVTVSLADKTASVSDISVANPPGFEGDALLRVKSVSVLLGDVSRGLVVIKNIDVDGLTVTYEVGPAGTNLDVLRKNIKSAPAAPSAASAKTAESVQVVIEKLKAMQVQVVPAVPGAGNSTVTLPQVTIRNIGSRKNPDAPAQAAAQIVNHILAAASVAALNTGLSSASLSGDVDQVKGKLKELLQK